MILRNKITRKCCRISTAILALTISLAFAVEQNGSEGRESSHQSIASDGLVAGVNTGNVANVANDSDPLPPTEEQKLFNVAPGFEVQLFASEPSISKPIDMAFDATGSLWVASSGVSGNQRGRITRLDDTDGDGQVDRFNEFASDLRTPMAILPHMSGVIVYSFPSLYYLADENGDGLADKLKVLVSEFRIANVQGKARNLVRPFDGLIHANVELDSEAGFQTKDQRNLTLESTGTVKFRKDGTGIILTTTGRTSPGRLAFDKYGYLYSVDCQSNTIHQLFEYSRYPDLSNGKSAFGFAPAIRDTRNLDSISALAIYEDDKFPAEYHGNLFSGNIASNRIQRIGIKYRGSTPEATGKPDFLVSTDPRFRPVDIDVGPDGALYVADFYSNKVGHQDKSSGHGKRDNHRGRIWRIVYVGDGEAIPTPATFDLAAASIEDLIEAMAQSSLVVRTAAGNQIVDRIGTSAADSLLDVVSNHRLLPEQRLQALWALQRMGVLSDETLAETLADERWLLRIHATHILSVREKLSDRLLAALRRQLTDSDPHVRRAAMEAMSHYPQAGFVRAIVEQLVAIAEHDTHLRYAARLSVREQLRNEDTRERALNTEWSDKESAILTEILQGLN